MDNPLEKFSAVEKRGGCPVLFLKEEKKSDKIFLFNKGTWIAFYCPCGCGEPVWLPTTECEGGGQKWNVKEYDDGTISTEPSILLKDYCGAHFFIRNNQVNWCIDTPHLAGAA